MSVSPGRIFLWGAMIVAGLTFAGAIAAGACWAPRFRGAEGDGRQ